MGRIRRWPEVALTFLAEDDLAFTARGRATGLTPSSEPRKDRSGRREFLLLDPDGNRLAFFGK